MEIELITTKTARMETQQQTNGDAITVGSHKPMLDNGIDRDHTRLAL